MQASGIAWILTAILWRSTSHGRTAHRGSYGRTSRTTQRAACGALHSGGVSVKVLVTGDRGYIGSVMAPYLIEHGHDVVGFDTNYYAGCDFGTVYSNYRQIDGDIRDVTVQDLHGFEAVVHLAALSNDPLGD